MACCVYIYIMKKWIPLCFILSLHLFLLLLSLLSLIIHSSCYFQFSSHASRLALLDFIFLCMFSYYDCHYAQIEQGELLILISVLLLLRHFLCHIHALSLSLSCLTCHSSFYRNATVLFPVFSFNGCGTVTLPATYSTAERRSALLWLLGYRGTRSISEEFLYYELSRCAAFAYGAGVISFLFYILVLLYLKEPLLLHAVLLHPVLPACPWL